MACHKARRWKSFRPEKGVRGGSCPSPSLLPFYDQGESEEEPSSPTGSPAESERKAPIELEQKLHSTPANGGFHTYLYISEGIKVGIMVMVLNLQTGAPRKFYVIQFTTRIHYFIIAFSLVKH